MPKIKMSLSATRPDTVSFLVVGSAMIASLEGNDDIPSISPVLKHHATVAKKFAARYGVQREFVASYNSFVKSKYLFDEEMAGELASWMKDCMPQFKNDAAGIDQVQLQMLKDIYLLSRKASAPAKARLMKNVATLRVPELASLFTTEEVVEHDDSVKGASLLLRNIVRDRTGKTDDMMLNVDELKALRLEDAETYSSYCDARKVVQTAFKKAILNLVRKSGQPTIPVSEARKALKALNCDWIPKGFVGEIGDDGALYTTAGKRLSQIPVGEVVMNTKYDPKADNTYVCQIKGRKDSGIRTVAFLAGNKEQKFEQVDKAADQIDKYRKLWQADLKSSDMRKRIHGTITEFLYVAQARIGNTKNGANGEPTFGIATLKREHYKITPTKIIVEYPGKKGTVQHHEVQKSRDPVLYANLVEFYKSTTGDNYVLGIAGAAQASMQMIRYFKSKGFEGITPHSFRHIKGTAFAKEVIAKSPFVKAKANPSQTEAEQWFKEAMKEVGEKLHHQTGGKVTGMTAINSYIAPSLSAKFFTDLNLRVPKWVPKVGAKD